jgi:hypothetical protein
MQQGQIKPTKRCVRNKFCMSLEGEKYYIGEGGGGCKYGFWADI